MAVDKKSVLNDGVLAVLAQDRSWRRLWVKVIAGDFAVRSRNAGLR
jgi:hypothetical protein